MSQHTDFAKSHMDKCIEALKANFARVRSGRANPHILDPIKVDYYGQPTPITQLAGVKVPEASMLVVEPWDKTALKAIEKAIEASDLGITPSNDGVSIRLPFPRPTEERRRELAKECGKLAEDARVAVRNVRRDANGKTRARRGASRGRPDPREEGRPEADRWLHRPVRPTDLLADQDRRGHGDLA